MAAAWAYFDTSALIKRYIHEPGAASVRKALRRNQVVSSVITPAELLGAILRRRREGDLSKARFEALLSRFQRDRAHWELVEMNSMVLERAEGLLQGFIPIGFCDAIQVASLLTFQHASQVRIPLVTANAPQRDTATLRGLDVVWVA